MSDLLATEAGTHLVVPLEMLYLNFSACHEDWVVFLNMAFGAMSVLCAGTIGLCLLDV